MKAIRFKLKKSSWQFLAREIKMVHLSIVLCHGFDKRNAELSAGEEIQDGNTGLETKSV